MNRMPVAIDACSRYEEREVLRSVETICSAAGLPPLTGKHVLVKPNILSDAPPHRAVTTHPVVLKALLSCVLDAGGIPVVGDSPAVHLPVFSGEGCGLRQVCDAMDVPWVDFTEQTVDLPIPASCSQPMITVARCAAEADLIISAAKMKTHQLLYMTGTVKNLFGVVPSFQKSPYHLKFPGRDAFGEFMAGIYSALPQVFGVLDGIIAMEGPGPNNGYPKLMKTLIASLDCGAADAAACIMMGYKPDEMPVHKAMVRFTLTHARNQDDVDYPLRRPEEFRNDDFLRVNMKRRTRIFWDMIYPKLFPKKRRYQEMLTIDNHRCTSCGSCRMICPNQAVMITERRYTIDQTRCIRCFCCHEVCPADAIDVSTNKEKHT